nr:site-specific integrase [Devosia sp. A16]
MARNKLTEARCKSLAEAGVYGDGDGLWLRVQRSGSKNWIFIYRRGSARVELGLGGYGRGTAPVSLALAREKAEAIRQQLARGEDPRATKAPSAMPKTFGECVEDLLLLKASQLRNAKHLHQWEMTLRDYAKPLHGMPVADVSVDDVVSCLTPHWTERQETADRLRARIAAVIDYARARGLRSAGNPAQWRGLLDKLLPARKDLQRGHHHAADYHHVPAICTGLRASTGVSARAVEFLVLTAARSGEAGCATWSEFDLEKAIWTVPPERMKMQREHRVPLSRRAVDIVRAMKERSMGSYVFSGERDGRPVSDTAMVKALRRASPDKSATLHGLRSSFRDWAGDETQHPREVAEQALAHVVQGVEAAYRRKDALAKRRSLMNDWAAFCSPE